MILDFLTFEFRVQDLLGLVNWGVAGVGWWYCGWAGSKCKHLTAGPFSELGPSSVKGDDAACLAVDSDGFEPHGAIHSAAMSACAKPQLWYETLRLLCGMPARRFRVDIIAYCEVIGACDQADTATNIAESISFNQQ